MAVACTLCCCLLLLLASSPALASSDRHTVGGAPSSAALAKSLRFLAYENRPQPSDSDVKSASILAASTTLAGVPLQVGFVAPISERTLRSGDREQWLLKVLPHVQEDLVIHSDASDAMLLCTPHELSRKYDALTPDHSAVVVGGEVRIWPRDFAYNGKRIYHPHGGHDYPPRPDGRPFAPRFVNIGAMVASPKAYLQMLRCMRGVFADWPRRCPIDRVAPSGQYNRSASSSDPVYKYNSKDHDMMYEQACYHMYFIDSHLGNLPKHCPRMVMDYNASILLHAQKVSDKIEWEGCRPRFSLTGERPCLLHTPGSSKYVLPSMKVWWNLTRGTDEEKGHLGLAAALPDQRLKEVLAGAHRGSYAEGPNARGYFHVRVRQPLIARLREQEAEKNRTGRSSAVCGGRAAAGRTVGRSHNATSLSAGRAARANRRAEP